MKRRLRWIFIAIIVTGIAFAGWKLSRGTVAPGDLIVTVLEGPFKADLLVMGEIRALRTTNITPSTHGKLAELVPEGTIVEKDDPIGWMETEEQERNVEKFRSELEIAQKKLFKAEETARLQDKMNVLSMQEARSKLEYQRNQLAAARSKLEKTQRLVEAEISPRKALEDAELDVMGQELQLQNSEFALEKAVKNRDSQIELQKADVANARIDVERSQASLDKALDTLKNAVVRAPTSGMVLYKQIWKGGGNQEKVAVGDQLGPWQPFVEIPDLSELEVVTKVDEIDISRLKEGLPATISLDAFPEMTLAGTITKIAALAEDAAPSSDRRSTSGSGRKVFEVCIGIDDKIKDLRPGITARVSIRLHESEHEVYVPLEAVFTDGDDRVVYVTGFAGPEKQVVKTGVWNAQYITITDGVKPGRKIWLKRPDTL